MSEPDQTHTHPLSLGIALGAGAAKGMAHIGVLEELGDIGIKPTIVCGTSAGALVGAVYAAGKLPGFRKWASQLDLKSILRLLDVSISVGGGFATAQKLIDVFRDEVGEINIEDLPIRYAAVATDLYTGREVWLSEGPLWPAVRASIAVPGLLTPQEVNQRWLVDGGLVNPVPVSVCRAMGAEQVIAVNLLSDVIGKHIGRSGEERPMEHTEEEEEGLIDALTSELRSYADAIVPNWLRSDSDTTPGMLSVVASSLDIMQDRITRSRLAGEPPDALLSPRLADISLLEFHRANEAIEAGRHCVRLSRHTLCEALGLPSPGSRTLAARGPDQRLPS